MKYTIGDLLEPLIGLHAFTGCDTVSAFVEKGKVKTLQHLLRSKDFVKTLANLGFLLELDENLLKSLEHFVCRLYSGNENINQLRYKIYCSKHGKISCSNLPPCLSEFIEYCEKLPVENLVSGFTTKTRHFFPNWKWLLTVEANIWLLSR